jgi:hypothetical protein
MNHWEFVRTTLSHSDRQTRFLPSDQLTMTPINLTIEPHALTFS